MTRSVLKLNRKLQSFRHSFATTEEDSTFESLHKKVNVRYHE